MPTNPAVAVVCVPALDAAQCDEALAHVAKARWDPGRVETLAAPGAEAAVVRRCELTRDVPPGVVDHLVAAVKHLNMSTWRFALTGLRADDDPVTAMRYREGDHFAWHIDNGSAAPPIGTRKLSFSVQLSDPADYEGGDIRLAMYDQTYLGDTPAAMRAELRTRGRLVVFPSFHLHRVTPVRRGTRVAIVGWLHGPALR